MWFCKQQLGLCAFLDGRRYSLAFRHRLRRRCTILSLWLAIWQNHEVQSFMWHWNMMTLGWKCPTKFNRGSFIFQCRTNDRASWFCHMASHTHTRLTALSPGLPRWAGTRKVKPIWILLEQEMVSGSGISWAICKSGHRSRHIPMPTPPLSFLQTWCPSCRPTNSV